MLVILPADTVVHSIVSGMIHYSEKMQNGTMIVNELIPNSIMKLIPNSIMKLMKIV